MPAEFDPVHDARTADARSRPRLDENHSNQWAPQPGHAHSGSSLHNGYGGHMRNHDQMDTTDSITHQRLSNLRTPVDHVDVPPPDYHHQHHPSQHHQPQQQLHMHQNVPPPHMKPMYSPTAQMYSPPGTMPHQEQPRISLDLNALSTGREIDGLPFSGYDFLGGDLSALLGSVFRPPNEQIPEQFEENGQMLWQAYGQTGEHLGQEQGIPPGYQGQPGHPR